jgi:molybdopterin biosynthesis enzyme
VERHAARDECIRVTVADGVALPTGPQGSHRSSSLAGADALAIIPRGEGTLPIGERVAIEAL